MNKVIFLKKKPLVGNKIKDTVAAYIDDPTNFQEVVGFEHATTATVPEVGSELVIKDREDMLRTYKVLNVGRFMFLNYSHVEVYVFIKQL